MQKTTSDFVGENSQLLICEHKFFFYDFGMIFDSSGRGVAKCTLYLHACLEHWTTTNIASCKNDWIVQFDLSATNC
jgi:hypothetical protein